MSRALRGLKAVRLSLSSGSYLPAAGLTPARAVRSPKRKPLFMTTEAHAVADGLNLSQLDRPLVEYAIESLIDLLDDLDADTAELEFVNEDGTDDDDAPVFWNDHDLSVLDVAREQALAWVRSLHDRRAAGRPIEAPEPAPEPLPVYIAELRFGVRP